MKISKYDKKIKIATVVDPIQKLTYMITLG
jgi:hypothetical protein